jgi:AcrR family transcriptional regulator
MASLPGARTEPPRDGRARRAARSRRSIVRALFELVGEGTLQPTAQQVADRAGVTIRTVFRHFRDTEALFAEMGARLQAEVGPILAGDGPTAGLEARARALVQRRVALFERMAPYKRAANLQRPRSRFLRERHAELVRDLRADLIRRLPELAGAPDDLVEALDLVTSFEAWDRLRVEQRLGRERARAALERLARSLVREFVRLPDRRDGGCAQGES